MPLFLLEKLQMFMFLKRYGIIEMVSPVVYLTCRQLHQLLANKRSALCSEDFQCQCSAIFML